MRCCSSAPRERRDAAGSHPGNGRRSQEVASIEICSTALAVFVLSCHCLYLVLTRSLAFAVLRWPTVVSTPSRVHSSPVLAYARTLWRAPLPGSETVADPPEPRRWHRCREVFTVRTRFCRVRSVCTVIRSGFSVFVTVLVRDGRVSVLNVSSVLPETVNRQCLIEHCSTGYIGGERGASTPVPSVGIVLSPTTVIPLPF
jgi:hypothetical protein